MPFNNNSNVKSAGYQSKTSAGVFNARSIAATGSGDIGTVSISNATGSGGNTVVQLSLLPTVNTAQGTVTNLAHLGTSTIFTPSGDGAWLVGAFATSTATANVHALSFIISTSSGALNSDALETTSCTITISGSNVILTNTQGSTHSFAWFYIRIG